MKTQNKTFDAVLFMREQRERLSKRLSKMTKKEVLEFFSKREKKGAVRPGGSVS